MDLVPDTFSAPKLGRARGSDRWGGRLSVIPMRQKGTPPAERATFEKFGQVNTQSGCTAASQKQETDKTAEQGQRPWFRNHINNDSVYLQIRLVTLTHCDCTDIGQIIRKSSSSPSTRNVGGQRSCTTGCERKAVTSCVGCQSQTQRIQKICCNSVRSDS